MDIMKPTKPFAQYVTLNVLPALNTKIVLFVLKTESIHHTVHVNKVCSKTLPEFVKNAHTNVMDVSTTPPIVNFVPPTELMLQLVTVQPDSGMMDSLPNVENVTVLVPPVTTTPTIV